MSEDVEQNSYSVGALNVGEVSRRIGGIERQPQKTGGVRRANKAHAYCLAGVGGTVGTIPTFMGTQVPNLSTESVGHKVLRSMCMKPVLLSFHRYFLNVAAVTAVNTPSNTAQGKNTVVGLSEKGRDR